MHKNKTGKNFGRKMVFWKTIDKTTSYGVKLYEKFRKVSWH